MSDKKLKNVENLEKFKRAGIYGVLFKCQTKEEQEMRNKISRLENDPLVSEILSDERYNNIIQSEYRIHTAKKLSLRQQEKLLVKYGLKNPLCKPDHPHFHPQYASKRAGFYFYNDDWVQVFIIQFMQ